MCFLLPCWTILSMILLGVKLSEIQSWRVNFLSFFPSHKKVVEADDAINLGHINLGSLHNAAIGSLDHSFPMSIPACFILLVLLSVFCPSSLLDFFSRLVPALMFQHPFCATIIWMLHMIVNEKSCFKSSNCLKYFIYLFFWWMLWSF